MNLALNNNSCSKCALSRTRNNIVWGDGRLPSPILFVAEAPGEKEDLTGRTLHPDAKAGSLFEWICFNHNFKSDNGFRTNLVKCRPPNNRDPKPDEIMACSPYLNEQLLLCDPEIIVTVGGFATHYLLGDVSLEAVHGIPHVKNINGKNRIILPSYHVAAARHDPKNLMHVQYDFDIAFQLLRGELTVDAAKEHDAFSGLEEYRVLSDSKEDELALNIMLHYNEPYVAIDTEWARCGPWCLSVSAQPGLSYVIKPDSKKLLSQLNDHVSDSLIVTIIHNAIYDLPVLSKMGKMGVFPSNPYDTMVMAYLLQDEPQGLKPLAFRHCGMLMREYSEIVNRNAHSLDYIGTVAALNWPRPESTLYWVKGEPKIKNPQNIQRKARNILRDVESKKKPVDPFDRWHKIPLEERKIVENSLGVMTEGDLEDVNPETAVNYSARDADATIRVFPKLFSRIKSMNLLPTFLRDMKAIHMASDMMQFGMPIDVTRFRELEQWLEKKQAVVQTQIENEIGYPINPNSTDQVGDLLFTKLKLRSGKKTKSGNPSTDAKVLARLSEENDLVEKIVEFRELDTLRTRFAIALPLQEKNGRVFPTIRITRTETGRLSTSSPNLMAIPVRTETGLKVRKCFVASPGCVFLTNDYSQIELRTLAVASNDQKMLDIFLTGEDLHAQTASWMFNLPIDQLDDMKHRYPAKRINFGVIYGLTAPGLQRELIASGISEKEWPVRRCQEMIDRYFSVYSGVKKFMEETLQHARRYGFVRDMWGRIRYVPGIKTDDKWAILEAERQACNAPIQMGAAGVMKEAMGRLVPVYREWLKAGAITRPLIQIHDDLVFEVEKSILPVFSGQVKEVMENAVKFPIPIPIDQKVGEDWGTLVKLKEWRSN